MSEDNPEGEEDALAEKSAGQRAVQRREPVARKRYFLHSGKMKPEPHTGETTTLT